MKTRILLVLLAVMLALSLGLIGCGGEQPPVDALVSECAGNLSVMKEDTAGWTEAEVGTALEATDIIKCGGNSSAEITFLNGHTVELPPGTEIKVIELSASTETGSEIIRLRLIIGSIIFRVVNVIDPASLYEVETQTGVVAVKGSAVQITVSEDGTTLVCNLEGDIRAIAQGVELQVPEGECCVIESGQPPQLVVVFPDPNLEAVIREEIGKPTGDIYASDLDAIAILRAGDKDIIDLSGLEYCINLTSLVLVLNQITDISPLADLTNLTALWLDANQIIDISPLANLTSLSELGLTINQVVDISPLVNLTSLTALWLNDNQIGDISPLVNLTNLIAFGICGYQIGDISAVIDVTKLVWLELCSSQIGDISALAGLSGLTGLYLLDTQISDISPLTNLTSLTYLYLNSNQIDDISPLANLTDLTHLGLHDNQIDDISLLANLTNLTELWLSRNQISDISALVDNLGLGEGDVVELQENPLSGDSINIYIPELEARGVIVDY